MGLLHPRIRFFTEHLVFLALLIPTFLVLAAAVVSFAQPDPSVAARPAPATTAACGSCVATDDEDDER